MFSLESVDQAASAVASRRSTTLEDGLLFDVCRQWLEQLLGAKPSISTLNSLVSPSLYDRVGYLGRIHNLLPASLAEKLLEVKKPSTESDKLGLQYATDVLVDIFTRVARRKFPASLFMIDDVDYVDASSWEVVKRVIQQTNRLCLVMSYGGRASRSTGSVCAFELCHAR